MQREMHKNINSFTRHLYDCKASIHMHIVSILTKFSPRSVLSKHSVQMCKMIIIDVHAGKSPRVANSRERVRTRETSISPRGVNAPLVLSLIVPQLRNVGLGRGSSTRATHLRPRELSRPGQGWGPLTRRSAYITTTFGGRRLAQYVLNLYIQH